MRIRDLYRIRNIMSYTMFFRFEKKHATIYEKYWNKCVDYVKYHTFDIL